MKSGASILVVICVLIAGLVGFVGTICFMTGVILSLTTETVRTALMWTGFGLSIGGSIIGIVFRAIMGLLEG